MEDAAAAVRLAYSGGGVRVYHGDARDLLADGGAALAADPPAVVLTDPPYAAWAYVEQLEGSRQLDVARDLQWQAATFEWVGGWLFPLRAALRPDAAGWVFCNVHYMGCYVRWARLVGWPLRGIFALPPDEFLLAFGGEALSPGDAAMLKRELLRNAYGQNKSVRMLRALLLASPPGCVLDPFCGQGSTLQAAQMDGRAAVGFEIDEATCGLAVMRVGGVWDAPGGE